MTAYTIKHFPGEIKLDSAWDGPQWNMAEEVSITFPFDKNNPDFAPSVRLRMLYDSGRICGLFKVEDRYIVARAKANQDSVCLDSCVEFFVMPSPDDHYYNFEMNCGGTILLFRQPASNPSAYVKIPEEDLAQIERFHTMPNRITEEITEPKTWYLGFGIPISFFEKYSHINPSLSGQKWHGNFTKCADKSSHPCWLSWQPLSKLNFHLPFEFGDIYFE